MFIPKEDLKIPKTGFTQDNSDPYVITPQGMLATPPGAYLARYFEKKLETSLTKVDLQYVQNNLPKIIIEELEIAHDFKINIKQQTQIVTKTSNSIFNKQTNTKNQSEATLNDSLSPLNSAIACAIAKTTGQLVKIEKSQTSNNGKDLEITYDLLVEVQT